MLKHVGKDRTALLEDYKAALRKAGWEKQAESMVMDERGLLTVRADGTQIGDLSPLKGMPIATLLLDRNQIVDLVPLSNMPLKHLQLGDNPLLDISPLKGSRLEFLTLDQTRVTDLTALAGMPLRHLSLGSFKGTDLSPLKSAPMEFLVIAYSAITDIAPLAGMPLDYLNIHETAISDIGPLAGMRIKSLSIGNAKVSDISVLRNMPLETLWIYGAPISDLSSLKGSSLKALDLMQTKVTDLSPLAGLKLQRLAVAPNDGERIQGFEVLDGMLLTNLYVDGCHFEKLPPLKLMPLIWIHITGNEQLSDLKPFEGSHVQELNLSGCTKVKDVSPLAQCPDLERLGLPLSAQDLEPLRNHPRLKQLAYGGKGTTWNGDWTKALSVAEFWKAYDAQKGKKKK